MAGGGNGVLGNYLYFLEANQFVIRRITLSGPAIGTVTTVAGTLGVTGNVDGIGTAAKLGNLRSFTAVQGMLYFSDQTNGTIRKMDPTTFAITTVAGSPGTCSNIDGIGAAATFCKPNSITNDGYNLYMSDTSTFTIRKIRLSDYKVTTFAGLPSVGRDDLPGSITASALFNATLGYAPGYGLYLVDTATTRIIK